ncbi:putative endoglucanase [Stemphylium lycopersici]|nr:hypothetical protein TW65_00259 [Stemphylium lycopersici]RAR01682.1 putative endoglucanase [Stemphylium lycopersici]
MKLSLLAGAAIAQLASAHYFFDVLVVDGQESKPLEYIRENTRGAKYNPTKWKNTRDDMTPDMDDFRCNKGSFESAGRTGTAEVKAGAKMAMKLGVGATMKHPGPAFVYMSKAPGAANEYQGDGEWFKIFEEAVCDPSADFLGTAWCTWDKDRIEFTVPEGTPDGEYLIRSEHVGIHGAHGGEAEFYYACAQVKVTGGGNGTPGPTVQFPGAYKKDDPSWNFSIWNGYKDYPMPAPAVWDGSSSGGAQSPAQSPESTSPAQENTAPASTPAPAQPIASEGATHNAENCNGGKKTRRGRRAFRQSLRN